VHDLADAQGAQDAGGLAVAQAHHLFDFAGGGDLGEADGDADPAEGLGGAGLGGL
jgi:hypothetical protein